MQKLPRETLGLAHKVAHSSQFGIDATMLKGVVMVGQLFLAQTCRDAIVTILFCFEDRRRELLEYREQHGLCELMHDPLRLTELHAASE